MAKALTFILALAMLVQVIRPLGLPGLKRRADAWKIAVAAFVVVMLTAVVRQG